MGSSPITFMKKDEPGPGAKAAEVEEGGAPGEIQKRTR